MSTTSRGYTIDYTVDGDGPPLLLIAGTLCAARHWRDFGYAERLAADWRVINVDPLGHGASDTPHDADAYVAAGVTADLVAVLDAEGVDRVTAWGYSRGGWLACNLASRYPDRVDRIIVGAYAMNAHEEERRPTAGAVGSLPQARRLGRALAGTRGQRPWVPADDGGQQRPACGGRRDRWVVAANAIHRPEVGSLPSHVLRGFRGLDRAACPCRR